MKKKNQKKDNKNIIITILALCVIVGGIFNILNELADKKEKDTSIYNASIISIVDGDFSKNYSFEYNSSYVKVEEDIIKKEVKVTPIKQGDTTLKINYITTSGENKTLSYEISVRNGLSLNIKDK